MSPPRARKKTASRRDAATTASEREIALPTTDESPDGRATEAMAAEDAAVGLDTLNERIRRRAYELYCARDKSDGDPVDDWLEAERQIRLVQSATQGAAPTLLETPADESGSEARST